MTAAPRPRIAPPQRNWRCRPALGGLLLFSLAVGAGALVAQRIPPELALRIDPQGYLLLPAAQTSFDASQGDRDSPVATAMLGAMVGAPRTATPPVAAARGEIGQQIRIEAAQGGRRAVVKQPRRLTVPGPAGRAAPRTQPHDRTAEELASDTRQVEPLGTHDRASRLGAAAVRPFADPSDAEPAVLRSPDTMPAFDRRNPRPSSEGSQPTAVRGTLAGHVEAGDLPAEAKAPPSMIEQGGIGPRVALADLLAELERCRRAVACRDCLGAVDSNGTGRPEAGATAQAERGCGRCRRSGLAPLSLQGYEHWCALARAVTLVEADAADPSRATAAESVDELIGRLGLQHEQLDRLGRLAARKIESPESSWSGIALAGTVQSSNRSGPIYLTRLVLAGTARVATIASRYDPLVARGDRLLVLGCLVQAPDELPPGCAVEAGPLVWGGLRGVLPRRAESTARRR